MNSKNWPTEFTLENVRCFEGLQSAQLRPITLLVGENSTGKSTLLGCYSMIFRMITNPFFLDRNLDFNEEPFKLGSFKDIVRTQADRSNSKSEFMLKLGYKNSNTQTRTVEASFVRSGGGQPFLATLQLAMEDSALKISRTDSEKFSLNLDGDESEWKIPLDLFFTSFMLRAPLTDEEKSTEQESSAPFNEFFRRWSEASTNGEQDWFQPESFRALAPLRASPKRTYDPGKEISTPEGEHVPMLLNRLKHAESDYWKALHDQLVNVGKEFGMFSDISVELKGQDLSDPFRVQVKVRKNTPASLLDVGYGVSQCLPILVDVITSTETQFILQQPEVHLHPKAQAELASFFIQSKESSNNRFLIETHSDYIIDRVRINVRQGLIPAEDVSIIYFEPRDDKVDVHNMWLDEYGNLEGAPIGYRDFFHREMDLLLGFKD